MHHTLPSGKMWFTKKIEVLNIKFNCLLLFSSWCKIDYIKDTDTILEALELLRALMRL